MRRRRLLELGGWRSSIKLVTSCQSTCHSIWHSSIPPQTTRPPHSTNTYPIDTTSAGVTALIPSRTFQPSLQWNQEGNKRTRPFNGLTLDQVITLRSHLAVDCRRKKRNPVGGSRRSPRNCYRHHCRLPCFLANEFHWNFHGWWSVFVVKRRIRRNGGE